MVVDTCGAEADLALAVHASCPLLRHGPAAAPPIAADGDAGTIAACGGAPPPRGCTDTCRFAADGECDDGGPGAQYEECTYGTDCADCGPGTEPSERRGYAGVSHALSLAAGEYWLLVSDDGDGGGGGAAEDSMWHVRATCDGGAAPVAGEPCGRWRTCGACVARAACGWCASSASCHAGATSRRTAPLRLHCVCTAHCCPHCTSPDLPSRPRRGRAALFLRTLGPLRRDVRRAARTAARARGDKPQRGARYRRGGQGGRHSSGRSRRRGRRGCGPRRLGGGESWIVAAAPLRSCKARPRESIRLYEHTVQLYL